MDKIVIWGTGIIATRYMERYNQILGKHAMVVGFIDVKKKIDSFYGLPVWSKVDTISLSFDYIVIMNKFFEDICKTVGVLMANVKVISLYDFFMRAIDNDWPEFKNSSVLFYGDRLNYEFAEFRARHTFSSVDFVEKGQSAHCKKRYDYALLCPPRLVSDEDCLEYENGISRELYDCKIQFTKKILGYYDWFYYLECDRTINVCESDFSAKKFYIIAVSDPIRGWGNLLPEFLGGISHAKAIGYVPVIDMQNMKNQYLDSVLIGKHNAWLDFFEPLNNKSLADAYVAKNSIISGFCSNRYERKSWADIKLKSDIVVEVDKYKRKLSFYGNKMLGVVYRGTDYYAAAKGHAKPMPYNDFISELKVYMGKLGYTRVYLATEVQEAFEAFKAAFGNDVCVFPQKRYKETERRFLSEIHDGRNNESYLRGKEYLLVLLLLAECSGLYGNDNGATRSAIIINQGKYKNVHIIE